MTEKYRNKFKTPAEAARVIKDGDWVDFGFGSGFPELMDEALAARRDELHNVKIRGGLVYRPAIQVVECDPEQKSFQYYSWHLGAAERKYHTAGRIHFAPMLLRLLPQMYREYLTVDVACIPVSKPDADGYCGLGLASYCWKTIMEKAKTVIFEINEHMPTLQGVDGSHRVSLDEADIIVEGEHAPLATNSYRQPSEADIRIAGLAEGFCFRCVIERGSCLIEKADRCGNVISRKDMGRHRQYKLVLENIADFGIEISNLRGNDDDVILETEFIDFVERDRFEYVCVMEKFHTVIEF